jgi:hypothetical protein
MNGESGKGDTPRPKSISDKEYSQKYDRAFGKKPRWFETPKHRRWAERARKEKLKLSKDIDDKHQ